MSTDGVEKDRPKSKQATAAEMAQRDLDALQAKLTAHQTYLAGLNPGSIKAEDARRQIKILEEDLWIKTQKEAETGSLTD